MDGKLTYRHLTRWPTCVDRIGGRGRPSGCAPFPVAIGDDTATEIMDEFDQVRGRRVFFPRLTIGNFERGACGHSWFRKGDAGRGGVRWSAPALLLSSLLCGILATNGPEGAGFAELYTPSSSSLARALHWHRLRHGVHAERLFTPQLKLMLG